MIYKLPVLCLISLFILTSCSTAYQSREGSISGGYELIHYDDLSFGIRASGNGYTSKEKILDISLRASAEETKKRSGEYFVILNRTAISEGKTIIYSKPLNTGLIFTTVDETVLIVNKTELQNVRGSYFETNKILADTKYLIE